MSVNINIRQTSNETKWASIQNGDFAIIEGIPEHPLPNGLYRIFHTPKEEAVNGYLLIPMFDGPFAENMFPYWLSEGPLPPIQQLVNKVHIEIEVS